MSQIEQTEPIWAGHNRFQSKATQEWDDSVPRYEGRNDWIPRDMSNPVVVANRQADFRGGLVVLAAVILMALHSKTGWTFDWTYDLFR